MMRPNTKTVKILFQSIYLRQFILEDLIEGVELYSIQFHAWMFTKKSSILAHQEKNNPTAHHLPAGLLDLAFGVRMVPSAK